jgi:hypothetical protein
MGLGDSHEQGTPVPWRAVGRDVRCSEVTPQRALERRRLEEEPIAP